ncbi:uncharacterized protein KZ484_016114 [Pholidichthys leucotaenia]
MADNESDLDTDGLEVALDTLSAKHCSDGGSLKSKEYCSEFCELVEEYTGQWHVPLPQLKVLRTALSNFTNATADFPDGCQHIQYVLSSLALSFFELMLFFSKEEFEEKPLKDILDSFQSCHTQLLRHRNIYLQHVKQTIKAGGPWENPVLQGILKEADLPPNEVERYLSSELPVFLELRVRYLQACERMQEAMALAKSCLENNEAGKHLYFHQAYLTCLCKASLHESLHKEIAEIDGRDAVEIICNTESVEKNELLLSLCRTFLTQQLHNGDMYYIWDLVFVWSRLHLRAHPSRQDFLAECLQLASSATNVRAIFPFIKLVTAELAGEGVEVCLELCARALQLCDVQADTETRSLVCKTIAFLLPHDLEICRACALLVFCQERSLDAYRTVRQLYMHPDQEQHPHSSPVRTNVRFHVLQMLKDRLCFDPEFWNHLTLRTHCLELINDNVMKAALLNEMQEEEEKENNEKLLENNSTNDPSPEDLNTCHCTEAVNQDPPKKPIDAEVTKSVEQSADAPLKRREWKRRLRKRKRYLPYSDEFEFGDDPEFTYNLKSPSLNKPVYSLRHNHTKGEKSAYMKLPVNHSREHLSRSVKCQIFKRKGRKSKWLQGLPWLEQGPAVKEKMVKVRGKKRGRKPLSRLELSFPDNEVSLPKEESGFEEETGRENSQQDLLHLKNELKSRSDCTENKLEQMIELKNENGENVESVCEIEMINKREDGQHVDSVSEIKNRERGHEPKQMADIAKEDGELADSVSEIQYEQKANQLVQLKDVKKQTETSTDILCMNTFNEQTPDESQTHRLCEVPHSECEAATPAVEGDPKLDGPPLKLFECTIALFHTYSLDSKKSDSDQPQPAEPATPKEVDDNIEEEPQPEMEMEPSENKVKPQLSWKDKALRTQQYSHLKHFCSFCQKGYKGLNVMRHALSHLKSKRLKCILCGKCFKHFSFAKKHILDHIEIMRKQKPPKPPCTENTSVANGVTDNAENNSEPLDNNQTDNSGGVPAGQKRSSKPKMSSLKREDRIIKNLRTLIKKTSVLHKKCAQGNAGLFKKVVFKDEQVVIKDGLVTVKDPCVIEEDEPGKEIQVAENNHGMDITYHLCPSESCDRVFLRVGLTLMKHSLKCHIGEEKVLENTFIWAKNKCSLCLRRMQSLQHYKDHMKLHNAPLRHFCYHLECGQRFSSLQELKDHVETHKPFRPQCTFSGCEKLFQNYQSLHDHEWRHYIPVPTKEELEFGRSKPDDQGEQAPWMQRVILEEAWLLSNYVEEEKNTNVQVNVEDTSQNVEICADKTVEHDHMDYIKSGINGFKSTHRTAADTPTKKCRKRPVIEHDPLDIRDRLSISTIAEGIHKNIGEPHIAEHKTFDPEDPSYATFVKAPFVRPPPSTYLDESVLSMPKKRATDEGRRKKLITYVNKRRKAPAPVKQQMMPHVAPELKVRHRCDKCLSSFSSLEEFQKHQALNNCSSLFGFDSDDES